MIFRHEKPCDCVVRGFTLRHALMGSLLMGLLSDGAYAHSINAGESHIQEMEAVRVLGTAEEELKQSLGVSIITAEDIIMRPPANDLSEIIRNEPGVNLTGASASGTYGNQRQIDIRGMGPENTLVLIDGKPVNSRNGVRMGRNGERDTNGDTNWVPADEIERIEIIRGPAAARFGSGAAGGVVNIITRKPGDRMSGTLTTYLNHPENSDAGSTKRLGVNLSGPLTDRLSFRLYGSMAKTDADSSSINADATVDGSYAAGREGMRNRDVNALLHWDINAEHSLEFETGYGRQGNIYVGEYPVGVADQAFVDGLVDSGAEVRRAYRKTASVTHRGKWGALGDSRLLFQYEGARNMDCIKGTSGKAEGSCSSPLVFNESNLKTYFGNGELHTPLRLAGRDQVLTSGFEFLSENLDDPSAIQQAGATGTVGTDSKASATSFAFYLEDNIEVTPSLILTPGVRYDHHSQFGNNVSPSLNLTYDLSSEITLKGGIARTFKAPNLYQSNPNYWYETRGNGCPVGVPGPCYVQGNADLNPEVSVNKEIGVQWNNHRGWNASMTYFRNDYKNKIVAEMFTQTAIDYTSYRYYQWHNAGKAVIQGLEGNVTIPLLGESGERLKLMNNFTWMFENKSKETGQPLSIIPKYTINSTLLWHVTPELAAQATATFYGRQKPRTVTETGADATGDALDSISPYAIFGLSANYRVNKHYSIGLGINNLFDKTIKRASNTSSAGAYTYNEVGRMYYLTASMSF